MDAPTIAATAASTSRGGGRGFSPSERQQRPLTLHTVVGKVTLEVTCGRDRQSGQWQCPARERWGLGPHEKMTPELEDRVCLTATLTGSYEAAAQISAKWGSAVDDETIRAHVRRVGQRAEAQVQARWLGKPWRNLRLRWPEANPQPFCSGHHDGRVSGASARGRLGRRFDESWAWNEWPGVKSKGR